MKDEQILESLSTGDQEAFQIIYNSYYEELIYFSYRFVRDQDSCKEVVQEVFIHLWENRFKLKINSIRPYLYVAVKNKSLNYKKREDRYRTLPTNESSVNFFSNTTQEALEYEELQQKINNAIRKLPEKCRDIFILSRMGGLSYREISLELNLSIKTVETQMGIALHKLREWYHISC